MKNRKGFTLIELLVAITIIGIIMIMVLPAIMNLQRENQEQKFKDYERAVLEAAKAYEDQYEEDLFGRNEDGCASIKFESLIDTKLLTTSEISGYECNNNENGVIIRKVKGTSYYEVYLTCMKGTESKQLTTNTGFTSDSNAASCKAGIDIEAPDFTIECDRNDAGTSVGIQADVGIIEDGNEILYYTAATANNNNKPILPNIYSQAKDGNSGLERNQYVTYEWNISNRSNTSERYTEKNKSTFNIKDGTSAQVKKNIRIIEPIKEINITGRAEVTIIGENIIDRAGNKIDVSSPNASKKCKYFYDNARPTMNITVTGERTGTSYNQERDAWINEPVTIRVEVTDITNNNIYVGIQENSFKVNTTSLNLETISENPKRYRYELTGQTNKEINDKYTVCDKLGNCETQRVRLRIDTEPPTCEVRGDGNWNPNGANVTISCQDPTISGVKTCAGANRNPNTDQIKRDTTYIVVDNAGNTNTCSYNVETTTQYYQVTCKEYNKCRDSSCPTEKYTEHSHTAQSCLQAGGKFSQDTNWTQTHTGVCTFTRYSECEAEACGCNYWNTNGTWKFSYCDSNSCHVDRTRPVYK